jgi:hypothetical protein
LNVKNTRRPSWFRTYIEIVDQFRQLWQLITGGPTGLGEAVILHLGPFASIMAVLIINIFHPLLKNCFIKTPILC